MIKFYRFSLENGLRVLVHEDKSSPLVAMNILYDVGSRDENPESTGLAHLFEHLMFGGTSAIPDYDKPLQLAGGENNAFTNSDITDYYLTVPETNIETGFWLESDRMSGLDFSHKNLETQKSVVIEEFYQRYLNQPYGDAMLLLKPMAYKIHPYRWMTIGRDISHVENVNLDEVKDFFYSHYAPNNAILTLTGNISPDRAFMLANKWFSTVSKRMIKPRKLPEEPVQNEERRMTVERDVPATALYKGWHIGKRDSKDYYVLDLITDLLAGGESGRLYTKLVREKKLFSEINAYLTSDIDPGMVILYGRLMKGIDIQYAEESVNKILSNLKERYPAEKEMEKVKNKFESSTILSNTNILNKAMNISFYELLGNPDLINNEVDEYKKTDRKMVAEVSQKFLIPTNCSTLYYISTRKD